MKYAEITIIRNTDEETILTYITRTLGYDDSISEKDTIIVLFDDDTIYDSKDKSNDDNHPFKYETKIDGFPIYFCNGTITAFYKEPIIINDKLTLNMNTIFNGYNKNIIKETSSYNCIYEKYDKTTLFSIIKIKSNEDKPRFIIAYNEIFTKSNIMYFINSIFNR